MESGLRKWSWVFFSFIFFSLYRLLFVVSWDFWRSRVEGLFVLGFGIDFWRLVYFKYGCGECSYRFCVFRGA